MGGCGTIITATRLYRTLPVFTLCFMMFMLCMVLKLHSTDASICSYAIELALLSSYAPKES